MRIKMFEKKVTQEEFEKNLEHIAAVMAVILNSPIKDTISCVKSKDRLYVGKVGDLIKNIETIIKGGVE
jgi:hypothetical protein